MDTREIKGILRVSLERGGDAGGVIALTQEAGLRCEPECGDGWKTEGILWVYY